MGNGQGYKRVAAGIAAAGIGAASLVVLGPISNAIAAPAITAAQATVCPDPGDMPNPNNGFPAFTDNAVSVFVGGDFYAEPNAAESEGLHVIVGSAEFSRQSLFNIGSVGVGSGIVPSPGSVMLAVGENMSIVPPASVSVGANVYDDAGNLVGGAVNVGGVLTDIDDLITNNAGVTTGMGAAAIAPWADFPTTAMQPVSGTLAATAPTGSTAVSGNTVAFTGDASSSLQVFEIDAAALPATPEFFFSSIPAGASIAVNVTGGPVSIAPDYFSLNGVRVDDLAAADFGNFSSRLLWNFTATTSVTIGGSSQFLGSILGPAIDLTTTASTNGRIYVGGDFHLQGSGAEHHNYPWIPQFPCDPDTASTPVGSVTIAKTVSPGSAHTALHFTGTMICREAPPHPVAFILRWGVTDGRVLPISGLPIGATCEIRENLNSVQVDNGDGTFSPADLGSLTWATPVISVDGVPSDSFTVDDTTTVAISLVNTLLGTFDVTKTVTGPDGGYTGTRSFDVDWTCTSDAYVDGTRVDGVDSGTILVADGQTASPEAGTPTAGASFPVGTDCDLTEQLTEEPGDLAPGYDWVSSSVSPAALTIGTGDSGIVSATVTNTFARVVGGFTVAKAVDGSGASRVPDGTAFTVRYTYALDGVEVSGTLSVTADGAPVAGPQDIPVGTVVRISEVQPPDVPGIAWGDPRIEVDGVLTDRLTIDAEETAAVTVTNTASTTPPTGTLPATGADPMPAVWTALSLLLVGGIAYAGHRRIARARS